MKEVIAVVATFIAVSGIGCILGYGACNGYKIQKAEFDARVERQIEWERNIRERIEAERAERDSIRIAETARRDSIYNALRAQGYEF